MKLIANIVSTTSIDVPEEFNVVTTMDKIIHGLPTLIIDYEYVDKNYPDFDITTNKLGPDLYWTFKRTQRRDKFNEDLDFFITKVYLDLVKDVVYFYVDVLQYNKKTIIKILKKIYNITNTISYLNNDMIYHYGEKIIFGIDLKLLKFIGCDIDKIKTKIKRKSSVFLEGAEILIEYKKHIEILDNQVKYVPFFYSLNHEQNNSTSIIHIPRKN